MKYSGIGGQAVIEGIMMKNSERYSVAVRKPDGQIEVMEDRFVSFGSRHAWAKLPVIRGAVNFVESMMLGMKTLTWSTGFYEEEEEAQPSKFELWLTKVFGDKVEKVVMTASVILALVVSVVIFMWVPLTVSTLLSKVIPNETILAILEGVLRVLLFIGYIKLISRMEDIRRTFMYHGAEHKCINCVEHGLPLTVGNVAVSSKEHKRCGTSFVFIVMIITILFFVVIRVDNILLKFVLRLLLIPVIAGISYEILRFTGTHDSKFIDLLAKPGLLMQGLTTKEPDRSMIEVAIAAVERVFDWKAYLAENFPETVIPEESTAQADLSQENDRSGKDGAGTVGPVNTGSGNAVPENAGPEDPARENAAADKVRQEE